MPRSSVLLMSGGGAAVLAALVWLWHSTRTEPITPVSPPEPPPAIVAPASDTPVTAAPAPASSRGSSARVGRSKLGVALPSAPPSHPVAGSPSLESDDAPPGTRANTKNLHFGGTQLRAQHAAVEPLVRECVSKAATAGIRPSGDAILTYVVARRGDKYLVEDTSVDSDKTTLAHEGLVECLHRTALAMKFEGLPREAEALVVTRSIKLEDGSITEYKHVGFSYLR